ncbi:DUF1835 domain-containing protein [uncultured Ferrimonas sp.]|uniref:DUF1835 domain-containing protein n=1 Tax=uncultured Ferrimonas sp. TaxID=432640 RepID=UPI00260861ED|nr:DUF1835 domain-containing protein [uncultured Ferrimonas sp.]
MDRQLHITNGDSAVSLLQAGGIRGQLLPWRDVLHEGPVHTALSLPQLSHQRAHFLAQLGFADAKTLELDFGQRDQHLFNANDYATITLWFEHDLYDQLQLLQLLAWFYQYPHQQLLLVQTDDHLCHHAPAQVKPLQQSATVVTTEQLQLANAAWQAFGQSTPQPWLRFCRQPSPLLPHLDAAFERLLQELPSASNGLSRTMQQALSCIDAGVDQCATLFRRYHHSESAAFMGDSIFWLQLERLRQCNQPALISFDGQVCGSSPQQKLALTAYGRALIHGRRHLLDAPPPPYSLGGVTLQPGNYWVWDHAAKRLSRY